MGKRVLAVALMLASAAVSAAPAAPPTIATQPLLKSVAADVSEDELRASLTALVGFGTRHSLSDTKSPTRGIGAARRWTAGRFAEFSKACGGCLTVATPAETFTGKRIPTSVEIVDVLAVQRGSGDPHRVIIMSGHIDSRVSDPMNATSDAPGANDDGSGTAAVIEAARVLSRHKFDATIVYAVLSGEEQGLLGGKLLAKYAKAQGWKVEAVLNNDIIGNSTGSSGVKDATHVRVFSEGTKAVETPEQANARRYNGGEVDSPARNLARFIDGLAERYLAPFDVTMVYRTDRYARGGDQVPMLEAGYPAVRLTEMQEHYDRQHQDLRTENGRAYGDVLSGVDFAYLANVTRLNVVAIAALASALPPPDTVTIEGAVSPDTKVRWSAVPGAASYDVWWRATDAAQWQHKRSVGDGSTSVTLPGVTIDTWFFGVSAVSAAGFASPVEFPGAAGAFFTPTKTDKP